MSAAISLLVGGWLLLFAARALGGTARAGRALGSVQRASEGDVVEVAGTVTGGEQLRSPLQQVPAVYWHVRAIRVRRSWTHRYLRRAVDVDRSSAAPFWIRAEGIDVGVDPRGSRMGSGHVSVHADQASRARRLVLDGVAHELPAEALGSRRVSEGVLVPGQQVWVRGRLRLDGGTPVLVSADGGGPSAGARLSVNTTPFARRRTGMVLVALAAGIPGAVLVLSGLRALV